MRQNGGLIKGCAINSQLVSRPAPAKGVIRPRTDVQTPADRGNEVGDFRTGRTQHPIDKYFAKSAVPRHDHMIPLVGHDLDRSRDIQRRPCPRSSIGTEVPAIDRLIQQPSGPWVSEVSARERAVQAAADSRIHDQRRFQPSFRREGVSWIQRRIKGHPHFLAVSQRGGNRRIRTPGQRARALEDSRRLGIEVDRRPQATGIGGNGVGPANGACAGGIFRQSREAGMGTAHGQACAVIALEPDQVVA